MSAILTPQSFHADLSPKADPTTVFNAELVAVAVPAAVQLATVTAYRITQKSTISIEGAAWETDYEPTWSIVLTPGTHLLKKKQDHFLASDESHVYAAAVAVSLQR